MPPGEAEPLWSQAQPRQDGPAACATPRRNPKSRPDGRGLQRASHHTYDGAAPARRGSPTRYSFDGLMDDVILIPLGCLTERRRRRAPFDSRDRALAQGRHEAGRSHAHPSRMDSPSPGNAACRPARRRSRTGAPAAPGNGRGGRAARWPRRRRFRARRAGQGRRRLAGAGCASRPARPAVARRSDARRAARAAHAAAQPRLHGGRTGDPGAGDRRQHRHLLDRQRRDPPAARLPQARAVDAPDHALPDGRVHRGRALEPGVRRIPGDEPFLRARRHIHDRQSGHRRWRIMDR